MSSTSFELEDKLFKLDRDLHEILRSASKRHTGKTAKEEIKSLRELVQRIGSHRVEEKDTTLLIREMREKSYDI